ncbi:MAG TPA: CcmD family protein [Cyclobacteriaceae bacterium]|nr:CcmD family protein [Cyclobacteriaceae bacterium]
MRKFSLAIFSALIFISFNSFSQSDTHVEMADLLRRDGKIYTVVFGLVIILTGMVLFLIRVDRKIFRLEKQLDKIDKSSKTNS